MLWTQRDSTCTAPCCVLAAQSCLTLCDTMDHCLPGPIIRGIPQARILGWVAIPFSRGSSPPGSPELQANCLPNKRGPSIEQMVCKPQHHYDSSGWRPGASVQQKAAGGPPGEPMCQGGCGSSAQPEVAVTSRTVTSPITHRSSAPSPGADINTQASDSASALYEACKNGHEEVVEFLLSQGADANKTNKDGMLPLHIASKKGNHRSAQAPPPAPQLLPFPHPFLRVPRPLGVGSFPESSEPSARFRWKKWNTTK